MKDSSKLCKKTSGQQDVWRTIFPSAIEIEYGGRYPADFCIIDYFISSDDCELVQRRRRHPLVAAYRNPSCARPASLCDFDTAHACGRYLYCVRLFVAGISGVALECALLFWRHFSADYRCSDDGFYGTGALLSDVATI